MAYTPQQIQKIVALAQKPGRLGHGAAKQVANELGISHASLRSFICLCRKGKMPAYWSRLLLLPLPRRLTGDEIVADREDPVKADKAPGKGWPIHAGHQGRLPGRGGPRVLTEAMTQGGRLSPFSRSRRLRHDDRSPPRHHKSDTAGDRMIPESEWRVCQAPGCGKRMPPGYAESRRDYFKRLTCNSVCRGAYQVSQGHYPRGACELHQCGAPGCTNIVPRGPGEKPSRYKDRKSCSPACSQIIRAIAGAGTWVEKRGGAGKDRKRNKVLNGPALTAAITEAEAIAAFIENRGITYCPPKFATVTLNAALPESDAKRAIKRVNVNHVESSWKAGSKRAWQRLHPNTNA